MRKLYFILFLLFFALVPGNIMGQQRIKFMGIPLDRDVNTIDKELVNKGFICQYDDFETSRTYLKDGYKIDFFWENPNKIDDFFVTYKSNNLSSTENFMAQFIEYLHKEYPGIEFTYHSKDFVNEITEIRGLYFEEGSIEFYINKDFEYNNFYFEADYTIGTNVLNERLALYNCNKNWRWLFTEEFSKGKEYFPQELQFYQYKSHPQYKVIEELEDLRDGFVYNEKGQLVYTIFNSYDTTFSQTKDYCVLTERVLMNDFNRNKYNIKKNSPSTVNDVRRCISNIKEENYLYNILHGYKKVSGTTLRYIKQLLFTSVHLNPLTFGFAY